MRREENEEAAERHRKVLDDDRARPLDDKRAPENRFGVPCIATCRNADCVNNHRGFRVNAKVNSDLVYRIFCGRCNNQIHDAVPEYDDGPGPKLPTRAEEATKQIEAVRERMRLKQESEERERRD